MRMILAIAAMGAVLGSGCAGCDPLDDTDPRGEGGGTHTPWDAGAGEPDTSGMFHGGDASSGATDFGDGDDGPGEDVGTPDAPDHGAPDQGALDLGAPDLGPTGPVCGDGVVEAPETCDDGITADCAGTHDGGDGSCVTAGTCTDGFVFDGAGCVPEQITQHVHIHVANDCSIMVDPPELNVPRGQTVKFSWHNHSQFYAVDVWQSYIGGFTDLAPGMTWNEQFEWCFNVNPYTGYSDISSAPGCPEHRFFITCNGR